MIMGVRVQFTFAVLLFISSETGRAADGAVEWRFDYNAAVKEAAESHRPILLNFGTASCGWCKKLDATTFHDRSVIETLNNQFVPIRIDADKNERLTEMIGVHSFPTL